jgi:hypothetical protein
VKGDVALVYDKSSIPDIPVPVNDKPRSDTAALAGAAPANAQAPATAPANTKCFIETPDLPDWIATAQS